MHAGEWYAVAKDVTSAMNYRDATAALQTLPERYKGTAKVCTLGGDQEVRTLSEQGVYRLIMRSNKPEAEAFQDWVFQVIKKLREASGLEGFQVFRMMDKQHQKRTMIALTASLKQPVTVDYIKANVIADKAVSNMFGLSKMLKKPAMTPEMLKARQPVLTDTAELMGVKDKFNLDLSISSAIYRKYNQKKDAAE
ncbi:BRO domain-containing protein [Lacticaseibacillus paracasei subsp. paracasei Lpp126]|uniref:BRO domain-containing protein n=1 Tax=Lacticaseibacillus paracasei subsp. paracasei Lpp126 TaxID=1256206 RepID=S2RU36_LACPA|nr:BRO domain-containing protein [Lacticaseibacillus paracasei subsp. paracasei Lpp126]